jgi:hypothetical protein
MKNKNKLRDWATPITTGAFVLSAVTGIMLFFKLEFHLIKHMHEWLSWFLVIGTILHLIANGRASMRYLSKPTGKFILILFLLLTCASFLPIDVKHGEHPSKKISEAIIQSPLSEVAQIADHPLNEAINILKSKGIQAANQEQTIREIAAQNHTSPLAILDAIF